MKLSDLNDHEDLALVGLLREVVQADGEFSDIEREEVAKIRAELGGDRFDDAVAGVKERFPSRAAFKEFLKTIERKEARHLIFETMVSVAASDGVDISEEKPLLWLTSWWEISDDD
ncbi:MAG: TerB family tellurite resistance protein [Myxococcota bacterium]